MFERVKQHWKGIVFSICLFLVLIIVGMYVYLKVSTYEAMPEAAILLDDDRVKTENDVIIVEPEKPIGNIVFYQGGLVETEAYLPLAKELSGEGFKVFIPVMPINLAITDSNVFEDIYKDYSSDLPWYIGGHSLGGTSALIYAEEHLEQLQGVLLLASYPSKSVDISSSELSVLSITASNDQILNQDNFLESKSLLPDDTEYQIIKGGNHSNFGYYGHQKGDGESEITRKEQQEAVVDLFIENIER
ncbi:alpha/beta hydrolase [Marinilactibacillus psychrotolerans]|uniref:alpha/beta hydrolase n=1 Tax=Marinilactibacillus psychrotolerans TaxID=191770 RepID=UPI003884DCE6